MELNLVDVASKKRYEAAVNDATAYIEYLKRHPEWKKLVMKGITIGD